MMDTLLLVGPLYLMAGGMFTILFFHLLIAREPDTIYEMLVVLLLWPAILIQCLCTALFIAGQYIFKWVKGLFK